MKVDTIKDLEAVLKLCHKQGVRSITIDGITMAIGDIPEPKSATKADESALKDKYTEEDMLLWSVG